MKVLVLTQFYPPELVAAAVRVHSFVSALTAGGHEVTVVCEAPNHPQGIVFPGYGGVASRRREGRLEAWYVAVATRPVKSTRTRLMFYGSYAVMASALSALLPRPDVILASSPPLPVGAAGAFAATRHQVPWVFDVRDLWPDAAVAAGELSDGRMLRSAAWLERRLYRSAAAITTTTEPFRRAILDRVRPGAAVDVVPNGTTQMWLTAAELQVRRHELGLPEGRFVWTYAGNVGLVQGLDAALEAAALLGEGFQLLVVGDGPARAGLEERSRDLPAGTVAWRPLVPPQVAARYLRASDALLVSLVAHPTLSPFVPSKLFDFCAVGRPVMVAAGEEPRRLMAAAGAGLDVTPGDPEALAAAVRRLRDEPDLRRRLGVAGRAFAQDHRRERQSERMRTVLEDVAGAARGRGI